MWSQNTDLHRRITWIQNSPFLYNLLGSWTLEWPAYVCKWLKGPENSYSIGAAVPWMQNQRLVYSSRAASDTGGNDQLIIAEVKFPFMLPISRHGSNLRGARTAAAPGSHEQVSLAATVDLNHFESSRGFAPTSTYTAPQNDFSHTLKAQINHPGELNNIDTSPQFPFHVVSISSNGTCYVWDYAMHRSKPESGEASAAQAVLAGGHTSEGFALAWNDCSAECAVSVISGANDGSLCLWDISVGRLKRRMNYYSGLVGAATGLTRPAERGPASLNDASWIHRVADLALTGFEDGCIALWDFRNDSTEPSAWAVHRGDQAPCGVPVNAVDCSLLDSHVFATGANNGSICIWDTRAMQVPVNDVADPSACTQNHCAETGRLLKDRALWNISPGASNMGVPSAAPAVGAAGSSSHARQKKLPAINCLEWLPEPFQNQLLVCRQSGLVEILDPLEFDSTLVAAASGADTSETALPTDERRGCGVPSLTGPVTAGAGVVAIHCGHDAEVTGAASTVFSTGLELRNCFTGGSFARRLPESLLVVSVSADNILQVWSPAFPPTPAPGFGRRPA